MNKFAALLAAGLLLSGCVYNSKVSTGAEQLQHHRFVLTSVNGRGKRWRPAAGAELRREEGYYRQYVCFGQYVQRLQRGR